MIKTKFSKCNKLERSQSQGKQGMGQSTGSLKGGAPNNKRKLDSCLTSDELELINRGTDCFVNSVIQLIRNTEYVKFIQSYLPQLITKSSPDSYN